MSKYECSTCGQDAYYDGRCGDGPILMCGCNSAKAIDSNTGYYGGPPPRKTREVIKTNDGTTIIIIREDKGYDYNGPGGRYREKNGKVWDY